MHREETVRTYGERFAAGYDAKFLFSEIRQKHTDFEERLIRDLIPPGGRWLDVSCGTGYFLSRVPSLERAGLDISPAMLNIARSRNPGVELRENSYLERQDDWIGRWDLVSCMYFAYTFVESITDMKRLIENLASWTSPTGTCFLPVCPCDGFCGAKVPYSAPTPFPGRHFITAIMWSWVDEGDDWHRDLIAPQLEYMITMFDNHFAQVEVIAYPNVGEGSDSIQRGILARKKRPTA